MADQEIEINGGIVVYEWVGPENGEKVVVTPGGRFSKDYGGIHELANSLAGGGKRVLLWDRPNCGRSDIQLYGRSESHMRAETLGLMCKELGIDEIVAVAGSGGARDSIIFTLMWPEIATGLAVWHIVGGNYSSLVLANVYTMNELRVVRSQGIEGIVEMTSGPGSWAALCGANPAQPRSAPRCGHGRIRADHEPVARRVYPETERTDPRRGRLGVRTDQGSDADHPRRGKGL